MIVKINAFSPSIIFLQGALRIQLSITSFMQMSATVVTRNSKISFITKFKINVNRAVHHAFLIANVNILCIYLWSVFITIILFVSFEQLCS